MADVTVKGVDATVKNTEPKNDDTKGAPDQDAPKQPKNDDTKGAPDQDAPKHDDTETAYVVCVFNTGTVTAVSESDTSEGAHRVSKNYPDAFVIPVSRVKPKTGSE